MDGFYSLLSGSDLGGLSVFSQSFAGRAAIRALIAKGSADSLEELAMLLSPAASEFLEDMARISSRVSQKYFGKTIRMFAPLYLSNVCVNNCAYCGFARRHEIARKTLNAEEISAEIDAIYAMGFRSILLVASENPRLVPPEYIEEAVKISLKKMPSVSVEIAPSSAEDYARYVRAGCEGLTVFQETYSEKLYPSLHPSGPKADFRYRLETPERGSAGGMRKLGLGPLLGLNDWRFEILACALHAKFLCKNAWRSQISVSLPRMRPAEGDFKVLSENVPTDKELVQILCALRMFLPRLALVVSTRESRRLRDGLIGLGVTHMSAASITSPGGYSEKTEAGEQFEIDDGRSAAEFSAAVKARGYDCVWKDFDSSLAG